MVWAWMLWSLYALGTRTRLWFGHGCSGQRMLWEHERDYGLGMDALVIVGSRNTNEIMVWAWMLWSLYALGTRTRLWFGHGCSGHCMLWEHERDYGLGMDALVIVGSGNTNAIMVWAWMLWSLYALGTPGYRQWLLRKAVGFLLNSLELEEAPSHSGSFCEASHSLLCCPQGQNVRFVRSYSEPCHHKHP